MNYDEFMGIIHKKEKDEFNRTMPEFIITMASLILSLIGCMVVASSLLPELYYVGIIYGVVFMAQGILTMLHGLGLIPFAIWGWLY